MEPLSDNENSPSTPPLVWQRVRATWLSQKPSEYANLIAAFSTLLVVLLSIVYQRDFLHSQAWMAATPQAVFSDFELWRLWSSLFAHANIGHLISNSILFFILGYFLAGYFGVKLFPLAAIFFGGITNLIVLIGTPQTVAIIGISGVVYWMGGVWLALYLAIDKRRTYFQRILRILGVALGVFMPAAAFDPSVSYKAHLVGFCLGLVFGIVFYFWFRKDFERALVIETVVDT